MHWALKSADSLVIGNEVIGVLNGRVVHAISGATDDHTSRATEFPFVRHRRVSTDDGQSSVFPRQCHATVLWSKWHGRIGWLPCKCRQCSVARVIKATQTFESMIGDNVRLIYFLVMIYL